MTIQSDTHETLVKCVHDRSIFSSQILGTPKKYKYQQDAYEDLFKHKRVCIKSAHDLGKTFTFSDAAIESFIVDGTLAAALATEIAGAYQGGAYIIVTAPTWNMVKNIFFSEVRKKLRNAKIPMGVTINTADVQMADKWLMIGFSPKQTVEGDPSNFQGFHAPLVIIIFEEATGIPKSMYKMAEGMMTSDNVKWWAIGNPTDGTSEFAKLFTKFEWHQITWDCFLSPNLIENKITDIEALRGEAAKVASLSDEEKMKRIATYKVVAPQLLTLQWVIEKYLDWGEDSPLFQSKVLAKFPDISDDNMFSIARIEECMDQFHEDVKELPGNEETIGVDVARFGSDKSCIFGLIGNREVRKEVYSKKDTTFLYGRIRQIVMENTVAGIKSVVTIDSGAMGPGVIDPLRNDTTSFDRKFFELIEVNFGQKAVNETLYGNAVAEMYILAAKQSESPEGFVLKQDDQLMNELCSRKRKFNTKGQFIIESKDDYKKRIGHSPDIADAFVMAWRGTKQGLKTSGKFTDMQDNEERTMSSTLGGGW